MLPVCLLLASSISFPQVDGTSEPEMWPLFEFWNPLTWLKPKFASETMFHVLRESNRKVYQQLKKALLPSNLFFNNIRAQNEAWDTGNHKEPKNPKGSHRPSNRKPNKKPPAKED